jgi:hypothetical protein
MDLTIREIGCVDMDWIIDLAQDRNQWRAPMYTIMNFPVP